MKATHETSTLARLTGLTIPANADPALPPSLLLRCAATYIDTYGRTTGEFFDMLATAPFPPACAGGAINIAAHGRPFELTPGESIYLPVKAPHWVNNVPEVSVSF